MIGIITFIVGFILMITAFILSKRALQDVDRRKMDLADKIMPWGVGLFLIGFAFLLVGI